MPFTGKPSDACQRCKKLHAKCDGQRPTCGRCSKAKTSCVRLAEGLDLVLRDQTSFAKTLVDRRTKATKKRIKERNGDSDDGSAGLLLTAPFAPPVHMLWNIAPPMIENSENHARTFFMRYYVDYPRDKRTDKGLTDLIPILDREPSSNSPMFLATSAAALAMYGAWEHGIRDRESNTVRSAYVTALKATREALQNPETSHDEETILAICMLGLYEMITNSYRAMISPPRHYAAAAEILKEKIKMRNENNKVVQRILAAIRNCLTYRALHAGFSVDPDSIVLEETEDSLRNPVEVLDFRVAKAASVLAQTRLVDETFDQHGHSVSCTSPDEIDHQLITKIEIVDADLASWEFLVPASWFPEKCYRSNAPESVVEAGFYGEHCLVYRDIMVASVWNEWRIARLRTLAYLAAMWPNGDASSKIQRLVDEICATVPFIMGSRAKPDLLYAKNVEYPVPEDRLEDHRMVAAAYGGWNIFTPLKVAFSMVPHLRAGQQLWIAMQLRRLASIYGVTPQKSPQYNNKSPFIIGQPIPMNYEF